MAGKKRMPGFALQRRHRHWEEPGGHLCVRVRVIVDGRARMQWRRAETLEKPTGRVRLVEEEKWQ